MNIKHSLDGETLRITLIGELDESHATFVRNNLDEIFLRSPVSNAVIDMSQLTFMDSTGIGVLIGRYKLLRDRGIRLSIKNPSRPVDKVLSLTGIYKIMQKVN